MQLPGIYIHIPFCVRKCPYCDFNVYAGMTALHEEYTSALCAEIAQSPAYGAAVGTVFVGGGTPTNLTGEQLARILNTVGTTFVLADDAEITSEANPATADTAQFERMVNAGFNRLSLGAQSMDAGLLRAIGRDHTPQEIVTAVERGRAAGFKNISLDLMFALPGQTVTQWNHTLVDAEALMPDHFSTYGLTIEPGTRFATLYSKGQLELPTEDTEAEMYEHAIAFLTAHGYAQYEVSNFAKPGKQSKHNLIYWRNQAYFGFGAGAVSYVDGVRRTNIKSPQKYMHAVSEGADLTIESERLSPRESFMETLMVGLRLRSGVDIRKAGARFGQDGHAILRERIARLEERGLITLTGDILMVTPAGLPLLNVVLMELLD